MESTWQLLQHVLVQIGSYRRAFRSPNKPALKRQRRYQWLEWVLRELSEYDPDVEWVAIWGISEPNSPPPTRRSALHHCGWSATARPTVLVVRRRPAHGGGGIESA